MDKKLRGWTLAVATVLLCAALIGCGGSAQKGGASPSPDTVRVVVPSGSPAAQPTYVATPGASPLPRYVAGEGIYTFAWISDPQHYAAKFPELYYSMTDFLAQRKAELNLKYVICTGDLVNNADSLEQWAVAKTAFDTIADLPQGVLAGNHDLDTTGKTEYYAQYFGKAVFSGQACYGEAFGDNFGHYDLIDLGEAHYLFVYLSFDPPAEAVKWAKQAFDKYPDRRGVLCLHEYFTNEGLRSAAGEALFKALVETCDNLFMVLCGHRYGLYYTRENVDGREVVQMMMNYQAAGVRGGDGYFRLMQFDEAKGLINILTYSAYEDDYNMLDDHDPGDARYNMGPEAEEFSFAMPWR